MRAFCTALILFALGALAAPGAAQDRMFSLALTGSYTTSSKTFYRPNDADELLRSQFFPLDHIAGIGVDLRRTLPGGSIQIGLAAEVIARRSTTEVPYGSLAVPVEDGFTALPVELTGYFFIPIGTAELRVYMGGGGGLYFGQRHYAYGGIPAETTERSPGAGIHVLAGTDWRLSERLSLRGEIKFRDVQFETVNRFRRATAIYGGTVLALPVEPLDSRINIDGMHLSAGLALHL